MRRYGAFKAGTRPLKTDRDNIGLAECANELESDHAAFPTDVSARTAELYAGDAQHPEWGGIGGWMRARFGRQLRMAGNIAKDALIAGPAAIDRAIERLMPLVAEGGFLPALDDVGSPDMPFSHNRSMVERLQAVRLDGPAW